MSDVLRQACRHVFRHPTLPRSKRHGPRGYYEYQSYKPWLRDEFAFRCVYCLWRERWDGDGHYGFGVDHVQPLSSAGELELDYENLVYACNACNSTRRDVSHPIDPATEPSGRHLQAQADGTIQALSEAGGVVIEFCRLNRPLLVAARRRILSLLAALQASDHPDALEAVRELLAFPADLPDLSSLRPPGGNARPEGIAESFCEQRRRGELPEVY